jgi:hypothetical protein
VDDHRTNCANISDVVRRGWILVAVFALLGAGIGILVSYELAYSKVITYACGSTATYTTLHGYISAAGKCSPVRSSSWHVLLVWSAVGLLGGTTLGLVLVELRRRTPAHATSQIGRSD